MSEGRLPGCTVTIMTADETLAVLRELVAGAVRAPDEEAPVAATS